jgi:cell filamentation protein
MADLYCCEGTDVLRNKLNIQDEKTLNLIEAEQSRMEMMILYNSGFSDFTVPGFYKLHEILFKDIYDWAGKPRVINLIKREALLCGKSVWYSNSDDIDRDMELVFKELKAINRTEKPETFIKRLVPKIAALWQVHPFREGNTRTVVMFMTFFIESFGYYVDKKLLATYAGYVRNSFVLASFGENSEYGHLEKILLDAVRTEEIIYNGYAVTDDSNQKYDTGYYKAAAHEVIPENYENK